MLFPMLEGWNNFFFQKLLFGFLVISLFLVIIYKPIPKLFLLLLLIIYIPIISSMIVNLNNISNYYDIYSELIRYISFFVIFSGVYALTRNPNNEQWVIFVRRTIGIAVLIQVIITFLHFSPLKPFVEYWFGLSKLTITPTKIRVTGTLENPNYISFLMCSLLALLWYYKRHFNKIEIFCIVLSCSAIIFLSGTRTGLICLLIVLIIFSPKLILPSLIVFNTYVISLIQSNRRFTDLIDINSFSAIESFRIRVELLEWGKNLFLDKPFLGYSQTPIILTDNHYMMLLLRYGSIFMLFALGVVIIILRYLISNNTVKRSYVTLLPIIIPVAIFSFTGSFLDNFRLFFFYVLFLVLACRSVQFQKQ